MDSWQVFREQWRTGTGRGEKGDWNSTARSSTLNDFKNNTRDVIAGVLIEGSLA
jgi:hypothetical protein